MRVGELVVPEALPSDLEGKRKVLCVECTYTDT